MDRLLDHELACARLQYDCETGGLAWRGQSNRAAGSVNGRGYLQVRLCGRIYLAHRLAVFLYTGLWPSGVVDHIDGNRTNNSWGNLRVTTAVVNAQNQRKAHRDSHSGLLGVERSGRGYQARITVNGRRQGLGSYPAAKEAHAAYLSAKRQLHEGGTL